VDLAVLIVTYDRPKEIRHTIDALQDRLQFTGSLHWHIADDATGNGYVRDLLHDYADLDLSYTITQRAGWGANVNTAIRHLHDLGYDFIYLNEDDYVPRRDIDLDDGVALLTHDTSLGLVRYDGLAGHRVDLGLREVDVGGRRLNHLRVSRSSPEPYIYSNRPHLRHRRFDQHYGRYPEGRALGATEESYARRIKEDEGGPGIAALIDGIPRAFDHIGHSRQGTDLDPNRGK